MEVSVRFAAFLVGLLLLAHFGQAQQALCQRSQSSGNDGEVYFPNIPDMYFSSANASIFLESSLLVNLSTAVTYIFPIPARGEERNCSGRITSLQYCYSVRSTMGGQRTIFHFLLLRRMTNTFTVADRIAVETNPSSDRCTGNICCASDRLNGMNSNRFMAPTTEFTIGLVVSNSEAVPLAFSHFATQYNVPQFQASLGDSGPPLGSSYSLGTPLLDRSLPVLRFFLEPDALPTPTTEPITTTTMATLTVPDTTIPSTMTTEPTTSPSTTATEPGTTMTPSTMTTEQITSPSTMATEPGTTTTPSTMTTEPNTSPTMERTTTMTSTTAMTTEPRSATTEPRTIPTTMMTTQPTTAVTMQSSTHVPITTEPPAVDQSTTSTNPKPVSTTNPLSTPAETKKPVTISSMTTEPGTTNMFSDFNPTTSTDTSESSSTISEEGTDQVMITESPTTEITTSDSMPEGGSGALNGGIIGGILGGIVIPLVILVVICLLLLLLRSRRSRKYKTHNPDSGLGYINAVYEVSGLPDEPQQGNYAGTGPHAYSEVKKPVPPAYSEVKKPLPTFHDDCKDSYSYAMVPTSTNEYADVDTGPSLATSTLDGSSYDKLVHQEAKKDDPVQSEENVYMVPGVDEGTLYSQLDKFRTRKPRRDKIGLGHELGSGQFGVVYKGVWLSPDGEVKVAVKTLKEGSGERDRVKFLQEAAIMGQFKHPNVVTMYGVVTEGEPVLIVLELLTKGDLQNHLIKSRSEENESLDCHTLLSYCRQVASGMTYLSSKAFVHRDLAARNILVSDDEICKIADFGMSRDLMNEDYYVSGGGQVPVKWTAPEALHYKKYSTASDVWSYGALMYEIWSVGHKPFKNITNSEYVKLVDKGVRLSPPPGCPRALYSIMMSCWHPNTSERPGFTEITRQLSLPDPKLLKWSQEDKLVHPEAAELEADLLCAQDLYKDLQNRYIKE